MAPSKRKLPKIKEEKPSKIPIVCYCKNCANSINEGDEFMYGCKEGVNYPFKNNSIINCVKYVKSND